MILCIIGLYIKNNRQTESELEESEQRFRTVFEQAPIGIVISDRKGILFCNEEYEKILGRTQGELISAGWESYTHKDDLKEDIDKLADVWAGTSSGYSMVKRYIRLDGAVIWVRIFVSPLKFTNKTPENYLCMVSDITQTKKSEDDLVESEEEYKKLFHEFQDKQLFLQSVIDSVPDLLYYKDTNGAYKGCNKAVEELTGKDSSQIIDHFDQEIFSRNDAEHFRKMDMDMFKKMERTKNEVDIVCASGETITLETLRTPFYDSNGNLSGLIGSSRDITERKQREEEIVYLNHHDVLTGLYSRMFLDKEVVRLDSEEYLPLAVIIGDINGLKFVNDAFGHAHGDILLVEMAKILTSCCREGDIVARTGGDEFTILLPKSDDNAAMNVVDSIKEACLKYAAQTDKETYYTSISLGYAAKTTPNEQFSYVLKTAEEYMYRHKLLEHKSLHSAIISSIKTTMFEKSNETEEHAERMTELARKFGKTLGFSDDELVSLELVTALHDIGKISIDQRILDKPGKLNEKEWAEIKKHPDVGYRIALTVPELSHIAEYILCHHERWDGKGYPQGLAAEEIPLIARVLTIVDAYDAMTQNRSYRKAMPKEDAISELQKNAGTQFDPKIARIFIEEVLPFEQ
jgi:diguanylate cyclase (GGDEF)-like protein/PAS domain S-box-containing protein